VRSRANQSKGDERPVERRQRRKEQQHADDNREEPAKPVVNQTLRVDSQDENGEQ
jgi:hypothetical protein